jgi:purine-binding chemotaxis protein CheW
VYGVAVEDVLEVFRLADLAVLPGAAAPVSGLATWRGELLVVLDLRRALGLPAAGLQDLSRVVVVGSRQAAVGLLADEARGVIRVPAKDLTNVPEGLAVNRNYVQGITGDAVLVLRVDALLELQR